MLGSQSSEGLSSASSTRRFCSTSPGRPGGRRSPTFGSAERILRSGRPFLRVTGRLLRGLGRTPDEAIITPNGKGFVFLATDTTPDYVDTFAQPATPAKWTYRAIYRAGDVQVGQWSAPVSVAVAA